MKRVGGRRRNKRNALIPAFLRPLWVPGFLQFVQILIWYRKTAQSIWTIRDGKQRRTNPRRSFARHCPHTEPISKRQPNACQLSTNDSVWMIFVQIWAMTGAEAAPAVIDCHVDSLQNASDSVCARVRSSRARCDSRHIRAAAFSAGSVCCFGSECFHDATVEKEAGTPARRRFRGRHGRTCASHHGAFLAREHRFAVDFAGLHDVYRLSYHELDTAA